MIASSERARPPAKTICALLLAATLSACTALGAAGPTTGMVRKSAGQDYANSDIKLIALDDKVARRLSEATGARRFSEVFPGSGATPVVIGPGDVLDIGIWEAPPAVLFGSAAQAGIGMAQAPGGQALGGQGVYGSLAQTSGLPQQMVAGDGTISVPFVGSVRAIGRTPEQVAREIERRLAGRAHDPQAVVRLAQNEARTVTILGEVASSRRVPLGSRGERVLDVIAAAGGSRQPVGKTTVQVARGTTTAVMPLEVIVRDPSQNVVLRPDDVVTVLYQPFSFIALGAVNQNAEVPFEGSGLTLAQALGRIGGLKDERADIRGVFIFRLEDPAVLDPAVAATARQTAEGRVPVIYRLDLSDPSSFFAAQDFAVRDKDVIYVSVAPAADLPKFLGTISNIAFTTIGIANLVK